MNLIDYTFTVIIVTSYIATECCTYACLNLKYNKLIALFFETCLAVYLFKTILES